MKPVVEVKDLTVRFGNFSAVNKVSFSVQRGEIFGFLGANGAGKTTILESIAWALFDHLDYNRDDFINAFFNPAAFTANAAGRYGNFGRNVFSGPASAWKAANWQKVTSPVTAPC